MQNTMQKPEQSGVRMKRGHKMPDKEKVMNALERCEPYELCVDDSCPYFRVAACLEKLRQDALALLKEQEANMESVVRCKECKWYQAGIDINGKPFTRCNGDVRVYGHTMPDWFCADGERRTDDV